MGVERLYGVDGTRSDGTDEWVGYGLNGIRASSGIIKFGVGFMDYVQDVIADWKVRYCSAAGAGTITSGHMSSVSVGKVAVLFCRVTRAFA